MPNVPHASTSRSSHGARTRSTHDYDSAFVVPQSSDQVSEQDAIDQSFGTQNIQRESVVLSAFTQSVRPVAIVDVLPTLPSDLYPVMSYVVLSTTERLYKNVADVWTLGVNGLDIVADSITAGQIAAGAIAASEIAAGAITAEKMRIGVNKNLTLNGSFEYYTGSVPMSLPHGFITTVPGITSVTAPVGTSGVWSLTDSQHYGGVVGLKFLHDAGSAVASTIYGEVFPVTPDAQYLLRVSRTGGLIVATHDYTAGLLFYDATGAPVGSPTSMGATLAGGSIAWATQEVTNAAPAAAVVARWYLSLQPAPGSPDTYFDSIEVEQVSTTLENVGATVTIDQTGITILDGSLTLEDEFGKTVMEASGFSGSWRGFIAHGLYNADFDSGTLGAIGLGRTVALPYWTVSNAAGTAVLTLTDSVSSPGEKYLKTTFSALNDEKMILSDSVPVSIGQPIVVGVLTQNFVAAGTLTLTVGVEFSDDLSSWSGAAEKVETFTGLGTSTAHATQVFVTTTKHFARVYVKTKETVTHDATNFMGVFTAYLRTLPDYTNSLMSGWRGNSFPSSPSSNDRFFRIDLQLEFFYDGTKWLSTQLFEMPYPQQDNLAATETDIRRISAPSLSDGSDVWIERVHVGGFYVAAGTALSGSHKWVITYKRLAPTTGTLTTFATHTIDSGSSSVWRAGTDVGVDALLGSDIVLTVSYTKTGTPGNLYHYATLVYRIVAT